MSTELTDIEREMEALLDEAEKKMMASKAAPIASPAAEMTLTASSVEAELKALEAEQAEALKDAPTPAPMVEKRSDADAVAAAQRVIREAAAKPAPAPAPAPAPEVAKAPPSSASALKTFIDADKFMGDTRVAPDNLDQCFYNQNGLVFYYGDLAAKATRQYELIKKKVDVQEAQLYAKHRAQLIVAGEKATEKQIEAAVKLDPAWMRGQQLVIDAQQIMETVKSASWSLQDRRFMIIQLGAAQRDEHQRNPIIKEQAAREAAMQAIRAG